MRIFPIKKLYLPALSIVATVLLLLILVSVSTYRNLDREKNLALNFLFRQGLALIRSIEAGARTGMKSPMWQEISLGSLMQETAKDNEISHVYLVDAKGKIVHHSDPSKQGSSPGWIPEITGANPVVTRILKPEGDPQIYELAKLFSPLFEPSMSQHQNRMVSSEQRISSHSHSGDTIILGMKMESVAQARRADIQHAFIMAAIILVLGSGALFFIFVIQNYYLVDKTLKQTKEYTRQVIASMANGILSLDTEGRIASYNQPAIELLGLTENEVKGKNLESLIDFAVCGIQKTLKDCVLVLDQEIFYKNKTGDVIPLALSSTPILDEAGTCQGAVIVLRDLSDIKKLEEKVRRSEKLAAVGQLAAGVAHEIRNPLSSIRGFAQFLSHSLKDRPQDKEYAETMVIEVDRINGVVANLLTFARPTTVEISPTVISELVEHCVRLVEADAVSRGVNVQMKISDLAKLPLDANQITQALLNLLLNALQALPPKGNIEIGAELDGTDARLHLWVKDDGPGIPNNLMEKIFEPFYTTHEKGTGLGLAIVHKIAENHNGEVRVNSPPPGMTQGSCFSIFLPIIVSRNTRDKFKRTEN